jgi:hypothetical protein
MRSVRHSWKSRCLCGSEILVWCALFVASPTASAGQEASANTGAAPASVSKPDPAARARVVESYSKLPLSFEKNNGQTDQQVRFFSRESGYTLFLTGDEAVLALGGRQDKADGKMLALEGKGESVTTQLRQATGRTANSESLNTSVVRMKLVGANPGAEVSGLEELPGKSNYFIGNDPKEWRTNVPNYAKVRYQEVYPGVDLVYYGNQRQLEYDFVVAPGTDPKAITLDMGTGLVPPRKGHPETAPLRIDANGDLLVRLNGGDVRFHKPVVYQPAFAAGFPTPGKKFVDGRYRLNGGNRISFEIASYDRARPLVIDPVLTYSSLLGGSGYNDGYGIAVDGSGNAYVTGQTQAANFPRMNQIAGACQGACGHGDQFDVFVAEIDAAGNALVYSSYLGGSGDDEGYSIAVDGFGNAYVTGTTVSTDFPRVNQIPGACRGSCGSSGYGTAFVTKISAAGNALAYSSLIGGSYVDQGFAIAVDGLGNAYLTGENQSNDFPRVNQIPGACRGTCGTSNSENVFVTKIDAAGSALVYSSLIGGSYAEHGHAIAVDSSGNAYLTGATDSSDFPRVNQIPGACQGTCIVGGVVFLTKIDAAGDALVYSSFIGGSTSDLGSGIALDSSGNTYLTGYTSSSDFPRVNQISSACQGHCGSGDNYDAFVTKIDAAGSSLVYSSLVGGSRSENVFGIGNGGIAVDDSGNAYVTGFTESTDFPRVNQIPGACLGTCGIVGGVYRDAFVIEVSADGNALVYSSYLGGSGSDFGVGVAVDSSGNVYLSGTTTSNDFPLVNQIPGGCQGSCGAPDGAAFVTRISSGNAAVNLSPESLDFGIQGTNRPNTPQLITLTNSGDAPLSITSSSITGTNSGDFDQWNNCPISPSMLAPGDHCTITVVFAPTETGTLNADVTITDNAPDSPQMVPITGIGVGGKVRPK